jgi:hypothetical protein
MEEKLRSLFKMKFWSEFATFAILPLAAFLLLTVSLISHFDLIPLLHMGASRELLVLALSVCLLLSGGVIGVKRFLLPYARDHRLLKNKEYRVIEGVVLRYDFRNDGGDPPSTVEIPIIQDRVTGEILELDLGSYLIQNACYRIGYLPHTGIAVVDKRI